MFMGRKLYSCFDLELLIREVGGHFVFISYSFIYFFIVISFLSFVA